MKAVFFGFLLSFCRSELARDGGLTAYISIPAVTAAYGFALTATHFFTSAKKK